MIRLPAIPRSTAQPATAPPDRALAPTDRRPAVTRPGRGLAIRPAFTLLEVLLAVAIFSIVLTAVHTVFHGALRLREKTTGTIEESLPLQQTLAILKRDLANLVPPGQTLFGQLQTTATTGNETSSIPTSAFALASGDQAQLASPQFCTSVGIIDDYLPWAEVQRVTYYLTDPANDTPGRDLVRSVTRNLLPTLEEEPEDQWLMSGIESMLFLFYDGFEWREDWDSTLDDPKLPLAIKVQLQLASEEYRSTWLPPIELVVPVFVQTSTNTAEETDGGQL